MVERLLGKRWLVIVVGVLITTAPLMGLALFVNFSLRGDLEQIAMERRKMSAAAAAHVLQVRLEGDIAYGEAFAGRRLLQKALQTGDAAELRRHLKDLVGESGSLERALVCSREGVRLANYPPDPHVIGQSVSNRDWFKGVSLSRKPYVSEFYLRDAQPRRYLFSIAMPIVSPGGEMIGILHMSPKENYLKEALGGLSSHGNDIVYAVDRKGHLVYHPDYPVDRLIDLSSSPAVANVKRGLEGADKLKDPRTGETAVAAYHPLAQFGWGVITQLPLKESLAPVTRIVNGVYLFLGIMLLGGGLLAYRWAELLNRSQRLSLQLTERTEELGHANERLNEQAAELEAQAAELEQERRQLERKVAERTAALSAEVEERRRAEEKLLKLSQAVEQSPVSIVITDSAGNIEFVNPKFTQITGYTPEEVLGRNPRILKSGETPPEEYERLWAAITSGKVWSGEFHNRKKDGEIFWEAATISPVMNPGGEVTHYIAVKEDITERKKLEGQLRHVQKMEAIGTLAGGIAHDFNNILTAVIGFASLLEMKMAADDPLRSNVTQILTAADRAVNLTRSLLAFSREQAIETRPVDLNAIVTGMEKMLRRLIREDFELRIAPAEEKLTVMADSGQIEQVLLNLTTNARDAMTSGGSIAIATGEVMLDAEFRRSHGFGEPGRYALLVFADDGTGMDERTRQRIFEPFFTTKEVGKGTGLGLSICYGIVKQHRGYITCYSEPGSGTTFRVYLPLVRAAAGQEEEAPSLPAPRGRGETLLVAEDDAAVRSLTTSLLEEFGYRVVQAQDGEEAVTRFRERQADIGLCLLDVVMPKKKGAEAFEEIRSIRPDARVLFMSGYQPDLTLQSGLVKEGANFVTKPVAPSELLHKVREMLDSS